MTSAPRARSSDRDVLGSAALEMAISVDVSTLMARSVVGTKMPTRSASGVAPDELDQALGLLEELRDGRAAVLAIVVARLLEGLPAPLE